jgi:hypothetical protein
MLPTQFDPIEYERLVNVSILTEKRECDRETVSEILENTKFLKVYSKYSTNTNIHNTYRELYNLAEELYNRDNPSSYYCKIKMDTINGITEKMLDVYGSRNRQ